MSRVSEKCVRTTYDSGKLHDLNSSVSNNKKHKVVFGAPPRMSEDDHGMRGSVIRHDLV